MEKQSYLNNVKSHDLPEATSAEIISTVDYFRIYDTKHELKNAPSSASSKYDCFFFFRLYIFKLLSSSKRKFQVSLQCLRALCV